MTIDDFLFEVGRIIGGQEFANREALEAAARVVAKEARDELGTYQGAIGGLPPWAPLAHATRERRVELGFTANDPLLRSGGLRDSIDVSVSPGEAVIGSNHPGARSHELGTDKIPQRSFLAGAAHRKTEEVLAIIGEHAIAHLLPGGRK